MTNISKKNITPKNIAFTAMFAALCCVSTFIAVPLPIGYFNLGDVFVLVSAWALGPVFGAIAAGVGTALADILMSYVVYAPATFIIKAAVAVTAALLFKSFKKSDATQKIYLFPRIISAIAGEAIMVCGYFIYEAFVLGYGMGALASVTGNCLQAASGVIGGTLLISALFSSRALKEIFRS